MIKINLLSAPTKVAPVEIGAATEAEIILEPRQIQLEAVKRIVIILVFPALLYAYQNYNLPIKQQELNQVRTEIGKLRDFNRQQEGAVNEIKRFQNSEKDLQTRIDTINSLTRERNREVEIVNLIKTALSSQEMRQTWLQKMTLNEREMRISGFSMQDSQITQFVEKLQKSIFFRRVFFNGATERDFRGKVVKDFSITCDLERAPQ